MWQRNEFLNQIYAIFKLQGGNYLVGECRQAPRISHWLSRWGVKDGGGGWPSEYTYNLFLTLKTCYKNHAIHITVPSSPTDRRCLTKWTDSSDTTSPLWLKYTCIKKRSRITVHTQPYITCKNSYMFRLYMCSRLLAGYSTLKENYKIQYNKILEPRSRLYSNVQLYRTI